MKITSYSIRHVLLILCVALWIGAAIATHTPAGKLPPMHASDKTLHLIGYFVLTASFLATLWAYDVGLRRRVALALLVMAVYGALDEITQPLFHRYASVIDWLADLGGAAACVLLHLAWTFLTKKNTGKPTLAREE